MEEILEMIALILPSIFLFICTQSYRHKHKEITTSIYRHITYVLILSGIIIFAGIIIAERIVNSFAYLLLIPVAYTLLSFIGTSYILKKYYQCTAWSVHILFGLFTVSLFYISFLILIIPIALTKCVMP